MSAFFAWMIQHFIRGVEIGFQAAGFIMVMVWVALVLAGVVVMVEWMRAKGNP